jgi:hypothetical protein
MTYCTADLTEAIPAMRAVWYGRLVLARRSLVAIVIVALTALGAALWLWFLSIRAADPGVDVHAYYVGDYGSLGGADAFLYAPVFSQVIEPLRWLGWEGFRDAWRLAEVGALVALTGPLSGLFVFWDPVALEVLAGNIHILTALAIVIGFRWPAAWAFVLLTKVTPGIGLLWFLSRREWKAAAVALLATATLVVVSFMLDPNAWGAWVGVLTRSGSVSHAGVALDWPLLVRLPAAGVLVVWAARTNRRWLLPVAVVIAMPVVWLTSLSVLVASVYLVGAPVLERLAGRAGGGLSPSSIVRRSPLA